MKFRLLSILLVCLMATSVFAVKYTWVGSVDDDFGGVNNWSPVNPWATSNYNDEYLVYYNAMVTATVIDAELSPLTGRLRLSGGGGGGDTTPSKLNVVDGGALYIAEFRVGDGISGSSGGQALVTQTGGSVTMIASASGTSYSRDLIIGRGAKSGPAINGAYVISGGSLGYLDMDYQGNTIEYNTARLQVGVSRTGETSASIDVTGTFKVIGSDATVLMKQLQVGGDGTMRMPGTTETGNMVFELVDGAVSVVQLSENGVQLDTLGDDSVANLVVELTSGVQAEVTLLIENVSASATVTGVFDNITLLGGLVGNVIYDYNADTGEQFGGNDIALIIPEPATIALLSLGLFIIRRKK